MEMEGTSRLLLVAGLLAALLPAAAAFSAPQPGGPCEATSLAAHVALFCPEGRAPECCETLMAAAGSMGGLSCICRIAAEPQLVVAGFDATHLLDIYSSCSALRSGGAHIAAPACEGPLPPAAAVSELPPSPPSSYSLPDHGDEIISPKEHCATAQSKKNFAHQACAATPQRKLVATVCQESSSLLARVLMISCGETERTPSSMCCSQVLHTIDNGCLCDVGEEPSIVTSVLTPQHFWFMYRACGGKGNVPADTTTCSLQHSPPPPPPNSPPPPSPPRSPTDSRPISSLDSMHSLQNPLTLLPMCFAIAAAVLCFGAIATGVILWIKMRNRASTTLATTVVTPTPSRATNMHWLPEPEVAWRPTPCHDHAPPRSELIPSPTPRPTGLDPAPHRTHLLPAPPQLHTLPDPAPSAPPERLMRQMAQ